MEQHSFSDFSYAVNKTSAKNGYKEVLVCFIYNGVEVLRKIYIPEKEGTSYVFEAKKIIDQEIKSGVLASYSYKFVKRKEAKNGKPNWKWIAITAGIAAMAIAGMSVGMYFVGKNSNVVVPVSKFEVKLISNDCQFVEPVNSINRDEQLDCYLKTSQANKIVTIDSVLMGTRTLSTDDYDFDADNGNLKVTLPATDNIFIYALSRGEHELIASPEYSVENGKATVTGVNIDYEHLEDVGTLIVPEFVEDKDGSTVPVTEIKQGAFKGLSNLTDLSLPFIGLHKEVANGSIEEHMLGSVFGDIEYVGGLPVWQDYMDYSKPEGEQHIMKKWIIPNDLSDVTITSSSDILVDVGAFSECNRINDIAFKGNVVTINNFAFYNCGALESVSFDEGSVENVGKYAFASCATLTSVGAPMESKELTVNLAGVKSIDENAFLDCIGVQQTFISSDTETIEANAFSGAGGIILAEPTSKPDGWNKNWAGPTTAVVYGSNGELHKMLDTAENKYRFILASEEGSTQRVAYITDYVGEQYAEVVEVPNTVAIDGGATYPVRHLGMGVFYQYTPIKEITIHNENLVTIGNYCFASCYNLEKITFTDRGVENPENNATMPKLTTIGMGAFANCRKLVVDDYNETNPEDYTTNTQFYSNPVFPISINTIGDSAFKGCNSIKNITLPGLVDMGSSAFEACTSLKKVKVSAYSNSFKKRAFCDSGLEGVYYYQDPTIPQAEWATGESYREIPDECFKNTNISATGALNYTVIPWYTISIGEGAFEGCKNIKKLGLEPYTDPNTEEVIYSHRLKTIGARAFADCYNLEEFNTLKEATGLNSIGESAFERCLKLKSLEINGEELKTIPQGCFEGCESMESFLSTSKFNSIESRAFFGCSSLVTAFTDDGNGLLPSTLGKLGDFAFSGCSNISALTITHSDSDSPAEFNMGVGVFSGWKTNVQAKSTKIIIILEFDEWEVDVSNFVRIQKGWLNAYSKEQTNTTKWGWDLTNASSYGTWSSDLYTERYKCSQSLNNNLYFHIVD
ncbi:MAG: leucine-rich repeat domain-containing protein [Bacilli bacterium]|nr:leucine-rich repeat domain-containing protein [Bacilli bacterium]